MNLSIKPIGIIHSPYKQKFAIPRQPGLIKEAEALLELYPPYNDLQAFSGIEDFTHLWIIFIFHQTMNKGWANQVRPPRLGGNIKKGIFSTRSTFRPNPIGMSAIEFLGIKKEDNKLFLRLGGVDLLDATPVIDIKPYLPYSDRISTASGGFATQKPESRMAVNFSEQAEAKINNEKHQYPQLKQFITAVLKQDPRPSYKQKKDTLQKYAFYLFDFNIRWYVKNNVNFVYLIE